jgi:hypothetical protein
MVRTSYSQAGQRSWDQQSRVLERLLQLLRSEEFRDVLPRFQRGHLLSQFAPWIIRVIVSQPDLWDRDSALLIQNSLLAAHREFLLHANPLLRQGSAVCISELGSSAKATVPTLCSLLSDQPEVRTAASLALVMVQGKLPGGWQVLRNRAETLWKQAVRRTTMPVRNLAARVYRTLNYKLYGRVERLEACLAELLMENRDRQKKLFAELSALRAILEEREALAADSEACESPLPTHADAA